MFIAKGVSESVVFSYGIIFLIKSGINFKCQDG